MGLFDLFASRVDCPACGQADARRSLFGKIRCPNADCVCFDPRLVPHREHRNPRTGELIVKPLLSKSTQQVFDPGAYAIEIRYTNYLGEAKTFVGDRRTLRRRHEHYSICIAPSGLRVALARSRIENLAEIDHLVVDVPSPREQHVLAYHRKRGTTSPLFERLRNRYPDWRR
jgi:hypothetical protein